VDAAIARMPTSAAVKATGPKRVETLSTSSTQIVASAPTESCVSNVMRMSGQWGSPGVRRRRLTGRAFGGRFFGSVIRVVEMLTSSMGTPGAEVLAVPAARHSSILTISTRIAPEGQAETHAGA